jgi:hypothetical protein
MTHVKGLAEDDGNRWGSHGVSIIQHWGGGKHSNLGDQSVTGG